MFKSGGSSKIEAASFRPKVKRSTSFIFVALQKLRVGILSYSTAELGFSIPDSDKKKIAKGNCLVSEKKRVTKIGFPMIPNCTDGRLV